MILFYCLYLWFVMDYFGILFELLLLFQPLKAKISSKEILLCFGITLESENLLLALLYSRLSFSIILKPNEILFRLEILLIESLDIAIIPTYNVLNIIPTLCSFFRYLFIFPSLWTLNRLEAINGLINIVVFPLSIKWKIKGLKIVRWDNKKGISLDYSEAAIANSCQIKERRKQLRG
jgi:hypothetical protein